MAIDSVSDAFNLPEERRWAGATWKVRRLTLAEVWGLLEGTVRSAYMADVMAVAANLSGREKSDYLVAATRQVPCGEELSRRAEELLASYDGLARILHAGLSAYRKQLSLKDVQSMLTESTVDEASAIVGWLLGEDAQEAQREAADGAAGEAQPPK